jgi:hypothetical protein
MSAVLIRGEGIAATCCLRLPDDAGVPVSVSRLEQPRLPAIMVGEGFPALLTTAFLRESEQAVAQPVKRSALKPVSTFDGRQRLIE